MGSKSLPVLKYYNALKWKENVYIIPETLGNYVGSRDLKNSAVCVRTRTVNVNTFSTTVKDEILEGW